MRTGTKRRRRKQQDSEPKDRYTLGTPYRPSLLVLPIMINTLNTTTDTVPVFYPSSCQYKLAPDLSRPVTAGPAPDAWGLLTPVLQTNKAAIPQG